MQVLNAYDPASTPTTYNVDVSAYVPAGTKAAQISVTASDTGGTGTLSVLKTSGSIPVARAVATSGVNSRYAIQCLVELDANRTFDLLFSTANFSTVNLWLSGGAIP